VLGLEVGVVDPRGRDKVNDWGGFCSRKLSSRDCSEVYRSRKQRIFTCR